ncbi:MAG: ornithine carbamoyltransferase [Phycisphaerae bacterium]
MIKDFVNLSDFSGDQLAALLDRAAADKRRFAEGNLPASLDRKVLAMIFEKPSLRTRVSFEAAMTQLGGHAVYLTRDDIGLGVREPIRDVARVLGRMCDGLVARTFSHDSVQELARHAPVPVINALTDYSHPCQAMADFMTVAEHFGDLAGRTIAFVGDGNNVARSLAIGCAKLGMRFVLAAPRGYGLSDEFARSVRSMGGDESYRSCEGPAAAVADADVVYTDTWVSMGQEQEKAQRVRDFEGFQVNEDLMAAAPDHAIVLHCLPAYRDYEITDGVFEAHAGSIFTQAENRLHFQRALMDVLMGNGGIQESGASSR